MTAISKDGKYVQLWDLIQEVLPLHDLDDLNQDMLAQARERREQGNLVKKLLNQTARWSGQEFRLKIEDDAWVIEVFSVYGDEYDEPVLLRLVIPNDRTKNIRLETMSDTAEVVVPERKEVVKP